MDSPVQTLCYTAYMPNMLNMPNMPNMPSLPNLPNMLNMLNMPNMPNLPNIQSMLNTTRSSHSATIHVPNITFNICQNNNNGNHAFSKRFEIVNRPGVAGAVLQSPPSLINSFIH